MPGTAAAADADSAAAATVGSTCDGDGWECDVGNTMT